MKSLFIDTIRFTLISVEVVISLVLFAVYLYAPLFFKPIGMLITSTDLKIVFTMLGLPAVGLIYSYRFASDLTTPKNMNDELKKKFFEWEGYLKLRNRVYFGISLCLVGFIVNILLWLLPEKLNVELRGLIFSIANSIWFVSTVTLAIANLSLKAILGGRR